MPLAAARSSIPIVLGLATAACGPSVEQMPPGDSDAVTDGTSTTEGGSTSTTASDETSAPKLDVSDSGSTTGDPVECGFWGDDCGPESKCMPGGDNVCSGFYGVWCNGGRWDRTSCVHVDEDPVAVGEPCEIIWWGSKSDICEEASICLPHGWEVDEGRCMQVCAGTAGEPSCDDPSTACALVGGVDVPVCLQICDPEAEDCPSGTSCRDSLTDSFVCISTNL